MTVFKEYALFYDLLYREKDYEAECDFLEQVFARFASNPVLTILDLGCGTGGHLFPLAQRGYQVAGVDQSEHMLAEARAKEAKYLGKETISKIGFIQGDIRTLNLERTYDAVISMFAVMGYMTSNQDFEAAIKVARKHLKTNGIFFYDVWYGPTVLTEKPTPRYKLLDQEDSRVIRFANPEISTLNHTVQIDYKILHLRDNKVLGEIDERHGMRFFFPKELEYYMQKCEFEMLRLCPFLKLDQDMNETEWNVAVIGKAI